MSAPAAVAAANGLRAGARVALRGPLRERATLLFALVSTLGIAFLAWAATRAAIRVAGQVLAQLPGVHGANLVERLLAGSTAGLLGLLLLGGLTTAVGTLFLSDELTFLAALPIRPAALFARQLARTAVAAAAPTFLIAIPVIVAAAQASPRPALAGTTLLLVLVALASAATLAGAALAIAIVRLIPARRARFAAGFLSAIGLSVAAVALRTARPERLLDPSAALELLESIGTTPPPMRHDPLSLAARAGTRALLGRADGLATAGGLAGASLLLLLAGAVLLAPAHRRAWEETREARSSVPRRRRRAARSLPSELWRAEWRTLLRDASTPAQLGTLSAVAALYLLNLRLLPTGDLASRDLLMGLQTALALFLVGALALRFAYPAVSVDGRAALVLRTLPLSPGRHLVIRWGVRAIPALLLGLALVGASAVVLRPAPGALSRALTLAVAGALAIPALHVGLGALRPRYDAANPVSVALGPGGLFAIAAASALAVTAAPAVSRELALLFSTLLERRVEPPALAGAWTAVALASAVAAMRLGARRLRDAEVPGS